MSTTARQSVSIVDLLSSIQRCLELSFEDAGVSSTLIKHWVPDGRPRYEGQSVLITYRLRTQTPQKYAGANRRGFLANQVLQVYGYVRYVADIAGSDFELTTYDGLGYYRVMNTIVDTFQGLNIFSAYNDDWRPNDVNEGIPDTATRYTIIPCQMIESNTVGKPTPDPGWMVGMAEFELKLVQPLTIEL